MECGVDIAKISRFEKDAESQLFLNKFFTKSEIEYIQKKIKKTETLAGMFCAKEAVLKAFGVGLSGGIALKDISILHGDLGNPYIEITPKINYYLMQKNAQSISVSVSHDGDYAIGFCVIN